MQTKPRSKSPTSILSAVAGANEYGPPPIQSHLRLDNDKVPVFTGSFFTSKQRDAHSIHEFPYRASFKAAVPRLFIDLLTEPGDVVADPFLGRGTTAIESGIMGRVPWGSDINPLSRMICLPRLAPPPVNEIAARLDDLDLTWNGTLDEDLAPFFHSRTLREIVALRKYLLDRTAAGELDAVDAWIGMVAACRLTGHSHGYFSRMTLPPNQAVTPARQRVLNAKNSYRSVYRPIKPRIWAKTNELLKDGAPPTSTPSIHVGSADKLRWAPDSSVDLVFTSPPFLDVVQYGCDNWLRNWFCGAVQPPADPLWIFRCPDHWSAAMRRFLLEAHRVTRPGGWVVVEVGDVRGGTVRLDERIAIEAREVGLEVVCMMIHAAPFSRTAHIWGIANGKTGTNTHRLVVTRRPR